VRRVGVEARFTIRQGRCVQAASTDPREYLGQHLINFGHINEEQLQQAFDTQKETKVPLGRVLVMVELVTTAQLQTVIFFKTREGLLEALGWREGTWRFVPETDAEPELDSERPIDLREAASEAAARQQMWDEIRRVFPSDGTRCEVLVDPSSVESAFDRRLLALMAKGVSVGEAALELRAMDFQVYARLYDLANRHLLRPQQTMTVRLPRSATPMAETSPFAAALAAAASLSAQTTAALPERPTPPLAPVLAPPSPVMFPLPVSGANVPAPTKGPAFSSGFVIGPAPVTTTTTPAPSSDPPSSDAPSPDPATTTTTTPTTATTSVTFPLDEFNVEVEVEPETPSPSPMPSPMPPAAPVTDDDQGFGTYMLVKKPAEDHIKALGMALAARRWAEALLLAQRVLEHDPHDAEAIAALRVADAQLRRQEKASGPDDNDFARVPHLTMPIAEVTQDHLTSKERYVLSRIDGRRSLTQIAAVSPVQRAELWRIVERFVQQGVLKY
jgi:hypothetical protein